MELETKEREYNNYIEEHITNVRNAYAKYGEALCKELVVSEYLLFQNVIMHDQSKYSDEEYDAYRNWFFPCTGEVKDEDNFNKAWKHHYENNKHHPQYWKGEDMDNISIAEMLLDWEAMSMKFGGSTYNYYMKERDKKGFSDNTKKVLDKVIEIFK